jgi:hypothetical protein
MFSFSSVSATFVFLFRARVTHVRLEEFADLHPIEKHTQPIKEWISEQLRMGNAVRTAALTAKDPDDSWGANWKQARALLKKMEKEYRNID